MNKDPEYYEKLLDRLREKRAEAEDLDDTISNMLWEVERGRDPWEDEEEYNELIQEIEEFLK